MLVKNVNRAATANVRDARRINSDTGVLLIAIPPNSLGPDCILDSGNTMMAVCGVPWGLARRKRKNAAQERNRSGR
jgi:hypothetical protein